MTIKRRDYSGTDTASEGSAIITTACPFCDHPIRPQQGLANHLPNCPEVDQ